MTTVCHRPEGLDQLEAQSNFTKQELQILYRGFKNVIYILIASYLASRAHGAELDSAHPNPNSSESDTLDNGCALRLSAEWRMKQLNQIHSLKGSIRLSANDYQGHCVFHGSSNDEQVKKWTIN